MIGVGGLNVNDDTFASRLLDDVEVHLLAGFQRSQQCRIPGTEIHCHRWPVEAGNGIVRNRYLCMCPIHLFNVAHAMMTRWRRCGPRCCHGCAGPSLPVLAKWRGWRLVAEAA